MTEGNSKNTGKLSMSYFATFDCKTVTVQDKKSNF